MRIQVFSPEGNLEDDRLVSQDPEVYKGPIKAYEGRALRIEVTLTNKDDTEKVIGYIQKLTGGLPLTSKEIKKLKNIDIMAETPREEIWLDAKAKCTDQASLITYLRDKYGFRFVSFEFVKAMELKIGLTDELSELYTPMLRCVKLAKDPKNDKYDPQIAICFRLFGKPIDKVLIFINGEKYGKADIPYKSNVKVNLKKLEAMKFPQFMTYDEREKFRREHRLYMEKPETEVSKFYLRWKEYVEIPINWGKK